MVAVAFISHWRLYRLPFWRNLFLTEHINKRLTIIQIVIIVYNRSEEKQRNSMGLLTNLTNSEPIWNWKYKYTHHIKKLFTHTYYYWNYKHRNAKENVSSTSSGIHLLGILGALGQKVEALLSIFCCTKITLEWISHPPFLDLPHHYALPNH